MFPETKSRETLRFEGNKIHCSPRDQALNETFEMVYIIESAYMKLNLAR